MQGPRPVVATELRVPQVEGRSRPTGETGSRGGWTEGTRTTRVRPRLHRRSTPLERPSANTHSVEQGGAGRPYTSAPANLADGSRTNTNPAGRVTITFVFAWPFTPPWGRGGRGCAFGLMVRSICTLSECPDLVQISVQTWSKLTGTSVDSGSLLWTTVWTPTCRDS